MRCQMYLAPLLLLSSALLRVCDAVSSTGAPPVRVADPDYSPFTLLGTGGPLNGTEFGYDNFSPSDKVVSCNSALAFVDLDAQIPFNTMGPQLTLEKCANLFAPASLAVQLWSQNTSSSWDDSNVTGSAIYLTSPPNYFWPNTCIDINTNGSSSRSTGPGSTVYTWQCKPVANQAWVFFPENGTIMSADGGGTCLSAGYPGDNTRGKAGTLITTALCDPGLPATQVFQWDNPTQVSGSKISHMSSQNCIDAGHFGQLITWDATASPQWSLSRVRARSCPDPGNPPFLPRASLRDYTVGSVPLSSTGQDRLVILDGDDQDKNIWTSDDCGATFDCYDGSQPWPAGRALSVVIQAPSSGDFPTSEVLMLGGVNYNADGATIPYWTNDVYASVNGLQWDTEYPSLPFTPNPDTGAMAVWPGMVAADGQNLYIFGDENFDTPYAVYSMSGSDFVKGQGFQMMDPSTYTSNRQAPRSRYVFIAGADTNGCWLATDYNAGATWGLPDVNTQSTNAFYTSFDLQSWRLGPIPAPWAPRAAAALTSSGDRRTAWFLGGMQFTDGSPAGATFSDAYSISAAVCLYGDNGQVCSGAAFGMPNLESVSAAEGVQVQGTACFL
jgi:hypothetical protein